MSLFAAIDRGLEKSIRSRYGQEITFGLWAMITARRLNRSVWNDWKATANLDTCTHPRFTYDMCRQAWDCCNCDAFFYMSHLYDDPQLAEHINERCEVKFRNP